MRRIVEILCCNDVGRLKTGLFIIVVVESQKDIVVESPSFIPLPASRLEPFRPDFALLYRQILTKPYKQISRSEIMICKYADSPLANHDFKLRLKSVCLQICLFSPICQVIDHGTNLL
jgi:hypothetical protein